MSKEQEIITQALQDFKDEAERQFREVVKEKIRRIAGKQQAIAVMKRELAELQAELKGLTITQIEVDLKGE